MRTSGAVSDNEFGIMMTPRNCHQYDIVDVVYKLWLSMYDLV